MTETRVSPRRTDAVTKAYGPTGDVVATTNTYALGTWEQGALQVMMDLVMGEFDVLHAREAFLADVAARGTTLGDTSGAVRVSLEHLAGLVRAFSQADEATISATYLH